MTDHAQALERFYRLLDELAEKVGGPRLLSRCDARTGWPIRGVCFFFEPGELRRDGRPRVVRIGTHALNSRSTTTLWTRLAQHRGTRGGTSPGGGNHRASVFRKHVGAALLGRDPELATDPAAASWGRGFSAPSSVVALEANHERRVSDYIGAMPMLWVPVEDPPGPGSDRASIERGCIALLSTATNPAADPPSPSWLGTNSDRPAITASGLWNVRHVHDQPDPAALEVLQHWIRTPGHARPTISPHPPLPSPRTSSSSRRPSTARVPLTGLTDADAVLQAVEEFDRIGRDAFLDKYGFKGARDYFLIHDGRRYDSKPIVAAAYGYQHGRPLINGQLSGGKSPHHAAGRLRDLDFEVEGDT